MLPDGYTIVTISDEIAAKLTGFVVPHDIGCIAEEIDLQLMLPVTRDGLRSRVSTSSSPKICRL